MAKYSSMLKCQMLQILQTEHQIVTKQRKTRQQEDVSMFLTTDRCFLKKRFTVTWTYRIHLLSRQMNGTRDLYSRNMNKDAHRDERQQKMNSP